jgi:RNA polymerase sigma factor (sigma-70 family)
MDRKEFEAGWEEIRPEAVREAVYAGLGMRLWSPAEARDEAEDVVQVVMLRTWEKRHLFNPTLGNFKGWVRASVRNEVKAMARQRRSRTRLIAREFDSWNPGRGSETPRDSELGADRQPGT